SCLSVVPGALGKMYKFIVAVAATCSILAAADNLVILPNNVELDGPEARHHLLAEAGFADHQEDWTRKVEWHSSNPKVAIVDASGEVRPMSDGQTTITAAAQGRTATVSLRVKNSQT